MTAADRQRWFEAFLASALQYRRARRDYDKARQWAWSMSLIVEQLLDNDEPDPVEVTEQTP